MGGVVGTKGGGEGGAWGGGGGGVGGGRGGYTLRAREGQTGCEATEWESETAVRCMTGHGGRGTRRVVMTAGERGGSVTEGWTLDVGGAMKTLGHAFVGRFNFRPWRD